MCHKTRRGWWKCHMIMFEIGWWSSGLVNPGCPSIKFGVGGSAKAQLLLVNYNRYLKEVNVLPLSVICCCNIRNLVELSFWLPDTLFFSNGIMNSYSSSEWYQYCDYVTIALLNVLSVWLMLYCKNIKYHDISLSYLPPHSAVCSDTEIWSDPGIRLPCVLKGLSFKNDFFVQILKDK